MPDNVKSFFNGSTGKMILALITGIGITIGGQTGYNAITSDDVDRVIAKAREYQTVVVRTESNERAICQLQTEYSILKKEFEKFNLKLNMLMVKSGIDPAQINKINGD